MFLEKIGRSSAFRASSVVIAVGIAAIVADSADTNKKRNGKQSQAQEKLALQKKLDSFKANPAKFMDQEIPKVNQNGEVVKTSLADLAAKYDVDISGKTEEQALALIKEKSQVKKDAVRVRKFSLGSSGRVSIADHDDASDLVDNGGSMLKNMRALDQYKDRKYTLPFQPWSDDYWAIYRGILAARYADSGFMAASRSDKGEVMKFYDHFNTHSVNADKMSPAEKVDALICDESQTFTKHQWEEALSSRGDDGFVETWMGICHGWAPAAYMESRPTNKITVKSCEGTPVTFYPSDIKALASYAWAKNSTTGNARFIGSRCNFKESELQKDPASGRVKDSGCFDTNPGTLLLTLVNQIAVSKRGFVLDATFDREVWNQPVSGFSFEYFNPQTMRAASSLNEAAIPYAQFGNDKFRNAGRCVDENDQCRKISHVVGINFKVDYIKETSPDHTSSDSPSRDYVHTAEYMADIELDSNFQVIGGEWYTNKHPDFLWTPAPTTRVLTDGSETRLPTWNISENIPFAQKAREKSSSGEILGVLVESLVAFSNGERSFNPSTGYRRPRSGNGGSTGGGNGSNPPPVLGSDQRRVVIQVAERCDHSNLCFDLQEQPANFKTALLGVLNQNQIAASDATSSAICDVGRNKVGMEVSVSQTVTDSSIRNALIAAGYEDVRVPRTDGLAHNCYTGTGYMPSGSRPVSAR